MITFREFGSKCLPFPRLSVDLATKRTALVEGIQMLDERLSLTK